MRRASLALLVVLLLTLPHLTVWADETDEPIGEYEFDGHRKELQQSHFTEADGSLFLDLEPSASQVRVELDFLDARFSAWGADRAFHVDGSLVVFNEMPVRFSEMEDGSEERFTLGSDGSVRFLQRPMWLQIVQEAHGYPIKLEMNDGDATGQGLYLSRDWLDAKGIEEPLAMHEDGTVLQLRTSEQGKGYILDVPHFSFVIIHSDDGGEDLVMGRQSGVVYPHSGEVRFYGNGGIIEVDVSENLAPYDLLVKKSWIDKNIPRPHVVSYNWTIDTVDNKEYYVVSLEPEDTPETLEFTEIPWERFSTSFNVTNFVETAESGNNATLPLGPGEDITIGFNVSDLSQNITMVRNDQTTPLHPQAVLPDELATAQGIYGTLLANGRSLTGGICIADTQYSFSGSDILDVVWREVAHCPPPQSDSEWPTGYPYNPPEPPTTRNIDWKAYVDEEYMDQWDDFINGINHVILAKYAQSSMWEKYTGNKYFSGDTKEIDNLEKGSKCEDHLQSFLNYLNQNDELSDLAVYVLVTGQLSGDCLGYADRGDGPGTLAPVPLNLNYGKDHTPDAYYGKSSVNHLAKLIAQEVGHNWGEYDHVCKGIKDRDDPDNDAKINMPVTCNNNFWDQKDFWLHYVYPDEYDSSTQRIIRGTAEYDSR